MRSDARRLHDVDAGGSVAERRRLAASRECARHRSILLELAERRASAETTDLALDHLASCRECERELAKTALVLVTLRRLADGVQESAPAEPAWPAIQARLVEQPRQRWRPGSLAGAFASLALVFVLAGPMIVRPHDAVTSQPAVEPAPTELRATAAPPLGSQPRTGLAIDAADLVSQPRAFPARYPDNLKPATDPASVAQGRS